MPPQSQENMTQRMLSDLAVMLFHLNGRVMALGDDIAKPIGLTARRWQVLGAVQNQPLTVSAIGRRMGVSRQNVQRIANKLNDENLVNFIDNPDHLSAKLIATTEKGKAAINKLDKGHKLLAANLTEVLGKNQFKSVIDSMKTLKKALDKLEEK